MISERTARIILLLVDESADANDRGYPTSSYSVKQDVYRTTLTGLEVIAEGSVSTLGGGEIDFASTLSGTAAHLFGSSGAMGMAYDPAAKRLFVADRKNNRVLVFDVGTP